MHESWSATKRAQRFHGPNEPCTGHVKAQCVPGGPRCVWYHADLKAWEELPIAQQEINRHAFDAIVPLLEAPNRELTERVKALEAAVFEPRHYSWCSRKGHAQDCCSVRSV